MASQPTCIMAEVTVVWVQRPTMDYGYLDRLWTMGTQTDFGLWVPRPTMDDGYPIQILDHEQTLTRKIHFCNFSSSYRISLIVLANVEFVTHFQILALSHVLQFSHFQQKEIKETRAENKLPKINVPPGRHQCD